MLGSPRARGAFGNFWMEMLRLGELDSLPQLPANYPQMSATLGASMRDETLALLDDIVFARDADYRQLFDSHSTFVNDELGKLYALTLPAGGPGMRPVELPADSGRLGLLGQGSFLALNAHSTMTSPTLRGKYVREVLLCQSIPAPPANVDTKIPDDPAGNAPRTMRQKLEFHRSVATCAGCHQLMDPLGLALEHFDGIGAYRATDRGMPIDASGTLDGKDYDGAAALARTLRDHPDVAGCLARNLFRYVAGHLETPDEAPAIAALGDGFVSGGFRVKQLLLDVIRSDVFRYQGQLD
jgi:hypothetical protein